MSQKRQPDDGKGGSEGNSPDEKRQRVPPLEKVSPEVMKKDTVQNFCSALEPLLRKVVKEEVEVALSKHLASMMRNYRDQIHPSTSRSLQLQFTNRLSLPVFTGARIEGEECSNIKVALVDALTGKVVHSRPGSLAKVEIVVLEGDFEGDEEDNWTLEEFKNNIVREREGKRPLLTGDSFLNLIEGTGAVGDLFFTDNSSWTRSRKFRLGARVVDCNNDGIRVREAKTEPFIVKDHRGELYKKHYPPCLTDDVWRLEKIGKDGAFHKRLMRENINTVKDFLTVLCTDTPRLRNILGTGMSNKMWEVTVEHARTCSLDKRMYLYRPLSSQRRMGVVFDVIGQVLGLLAECQYVPNDELSGTEKEDAQKLVKAAYEHWEEVVSYDDETTVGGSSHSPNVCFPSSSTVVESSFGSKFPSSNKSGGFGFTQLSAFSPDIVSSIGGMRSLDDYTMHGLENMDLRYDQSSSFLSQVTNSLICDAETVAQTFYDEENLQYFDHETSIQTQKLGLESQGELTSAVSAFLVSGPSTHVKAQTRWTMLFIVLRWRWSIKRIVASKKSGVQ
ncbi:hypothetical protein HHK36_015188 [Tetracentron sinense]|uniref:Calmodulin-binding protein n=1 Tax=Tetracentron sinense TaxID=13715 RepID=A0A834Z6Q7_TETSI|nr:hypothetical protein HHK36_015188 [Tetracentron sinense]